MIFLNLEIGNILTIIIIFFMAIGGIFALIQWNSTIKVRRSEFLDKILNKLIFDPEMIEAMNIIDYDFKENEWYNKNFYNSELERKIDKYLSFIDYILYLRKLKNIRSEEFNVIENEIIRIFISSQLQEYLWNLYHFGRTNKEKCPYIRIIDYGIKKEYFYKEFKYDKDLFSSILSDKDKLLTNTDLLDFYHKDILLLIRKRQWKNLNQKEKIKQIYEFVRDEIKFGYNIDDAISASKILNDGYGQCKTKSILFMALLRGVGIQCRIRGFKVDKKILKGIITGLYYIISPKEIVHSWVEIYYNKKWLNMEGFVLDKLYLNKLQKKFSDCKANFCGYAVAVKDFNNLPIEWNENDTYIQSEGIVRDLGVFHTPDELFAKHFQKMSRLKKYLFRNIGRHLMNFNVKKIRKWKTQS